MSRLARARQLRQSMTNAERKLWQALRAEQLGFKVRRQVPIGPYIADFLSYQYRLIIEVDGSQHLESPRDKARDAWLESEGYRVLRFWNHEVLTQLEAVLEKIRVTVEELEEKA